MSSLISMLHHKMLVVDSNWNHFYLNLGCAIETWTLECGLKKIGKVIYL